MLAVVPVSVQLRATPNAWLDTLSLAQGARHEFSTLWLPLPIDCSPCLLPCCVVPCSEGVEFSAFMEGEGFSIIPIKHEHQLAYACNVLNLGNGRIISVHADSARQIVKHPAFKGDVQVRGTQLQQRGQR